MQLRVVVFFGSGFVRLRWTYQMRRWCLSIFLSFLLFRLSSSPRQWFLWLRNSLLGFGWFENEGRRAVCGNEERGTRNCGVGMSDHERVA